MPSSTRHPGNDQVSAVRQTEAEVARTIATDGVLLDVDCPIETLGLPVRTRNTLRGIGCHTIGDVLRLDLSASVRGLGAKSKDALVERLNLLGFYHPAPKDQPASEILLIQRSLERIEHRVESVLESVVKEIAAVKLRLRRTRIRSEL